MKKTGLRRFVLWTDLHWGREFQYFSGKTQPTHAPEALSVAFQFLRDFKPDVFILGGDNLNCGFISRFHQGKPLLTEGQRASLDYAGFDREILRPVEKIIGPKAQKVWMTGNHEAWIRQFIEEHPTLYGLLEPYDVLKLRARGWKVYPQGGVFDLGKWRFAHGDVLLRSEGGYVGKFPARKALEAFGKSIRIGHTHQYQAWTRAVQAEEGYSTAICVPGLTTRTPEYSKGGPTNVVQGFLFGYSFPDGGFVDYPAIIYKGRWVGPGGKVYRA